MSREFEAIAGMKLALALVSGLNTIMPTPWWCLLYLPGTIAGIASTTKLSFDSGEVLYSMFFVCLTVAIGVPILLWSRVGSVLLGESTLELRDDLPKVVQIPPAVGVITLVLGALYSDWAIAIVLNNNVGYPYDAKALGQSTVELLYDREEIGQVCPMRVV
jgi:hypothetical protein